MARLEDLKNGARVKGILPGQAVEILDARWHGSDVVEATFKALDGRPDSLLLYRDQEPTLEVVEAGRAWAFDSDGDLFRMVSEAHRIRLAYLFDPLLAVHTSLVEPLPHQITAVYERMLEQQPLRFLLADDPGAGKTIMTGLFIRELVARGDLERCLVVCPGMLVEQWQDELWQKFRLPFEIMTNDKYESARTGNWFQENSLAICRLDKLSRNEDVQQKLDQVDWDLVVVDEAHKLSASFFGGEIKYTKRYLLGRDHLAPHGRHFLLLTATPHNGKEEDFQLFLALLDGDRFEGRFRDGVHQVDTSDLMRRMVKEQLLKFDGKPLFPERRAYTMNYELSDAEAHLYKEVTDYVRSEFNRADALQSEGRKGTVGFALTSLQRRLASSPEAIYRSLERRRERLERRLAEEKLLERGGAARPTEARELPNLSDDDIDELLDEATEEELTETEQRVIDQATAAQTIAELGAEIETLRRLEALALEVRRSESDRKWEELRELLLDDARMCDAHGNRRKLVIFTEHRPTLAYLAERIQGLLGRPEAVVIIHGSMGREDRRKIQEQFIQDREVHVLIATDAAGEGVNLQRAHLMVNYDLPWNPNRLEQRFGRIHRIGQTEVCHLWNLVASETREGDVYAHLLRKLDAERDALGGAVFDVLGRAFQGTPLRKLLVEAIRYSENSEVRARLERVVDEALDHEHLRALIEDRALASHDTMDTTRVQAIREMMERAEARRLQPHFIAEFFLYAFQHLGGTVREREPARYELTHVPAAVRNRDRVIGTREPVLSRYERVTFEKDQISLPGKPLAEFVCPGHPLLDAVTDLVLERYRELLKRGALLVDPEDPGDEVRALFYLDHAIRDARVEKSGERRVASRQLHFVEIDARGETRAAGYAPYLDYRPVEEDERKLVDPHLEASWLRGDLEPTALSFAAQNLAPGHLTEVRTRREARIEKTRAAVKDRLTKEINYWDHRAEELRAQEQAGRQPRMNWQRARGRANDLERRLQRRLAELEEERQLAATPPVVAGGALVVPAGLLAQLWGESPETVAARARETRRVEALAMRAVMDAERKLGFEPRDVSAEKVGYDVESRDSSGGPLRLIEVKGRAAGATTVTISKNEIKTGLNRPEAFILALALVDGDETRLRYLREPFQREPDFGATSVNYDLAELLSRSGDPS